MTKSAFLLPLLHKVNAWQIRMFALTSLVLFVGCGSQALVNVFAASQPQTTLVATPVVQPYLVAPLPSSHCVLLLQRSVGGFVSDDLHVHYSFRRSCIHENNVVKSPFQSPQAGQEKTWSAAPFEHKDTSQTRKSQVSMH